MPSNEIIHFLNEIIQKEFPDELEIYNTYRSSLAKNIEQGADLSELIAESNAENEFMNVDGAAVVSLSLLSGTIKTVMELTHPSNKKKLSGEGLRQKWKSKLISEGFKDADAEQLVNQYVNQLLSKL